MLVYNGESVRPDTYFDVGEEIVDQHSRVVIQPLDPEGMSRWIARKNHDSGLTRNGGNRSKLTF